MKKILILLLIVFVWSSYAQNTSYKKHKDYYYQILLKKWLGNTDNPEKHHRAGDGDESGTVESGLSATAKNAVKEYYGIDIDSVKKVSTDYRGVSWISVGENNLWEPINDEETFVLLTYNQYWLVQIRGLPNSDEQIWFLISGTTGNVLSTYQDKVWPGTEIEEFIPESICNTREWLDSTSYFALLQGWQLGKVEHQQKSVAFHKNRIVNNKKNSIDSSTAVTIALKTATNHYTDRHNLQMKFLTASFMGDNKEHLLVYCYPIVEGAWVFQYICDFYLSRKYKSCPGYTDYYYADGDGDKHRNMCEEAIIILVSMQEGRVLSMMLDYSKEVVTVFKHYNEVLQNVPAEKGE